MLFVCYQPKTRPILIAVILYFSMTRLYCECIWIDDPLCDRRPFLLRKNCNVGVLCKKMKINREYLYDAYSERDHIPLAK